MRIITKIFLLISICTSSALAYPPEDDSGMYPPGDEGFYPPGDEEFYPPGEEGMYPPEEEEGGMYPPEEEGGMYPPEEEGGMYPPEEEGGMYPPEDESFQSQEGINANPSQLAFDPGNPGSRHSFWIDQGRGRHDTSVTLRRGSSINTLFIPGCSGTATLYEMKPNKRKWDTYDLGFLRSGRECPIPFFGPKSGTYKWYIRICNSWSEGLTFRVR
jgi:hypothetical protein